MALIKGKIEVNEKIKCINAVRCKYQIHDRLPSRLVVNDGEEKKRIFADEIHIFVITFPRIRIHFVSLSLHRFFLSRAADVWLIS